MIEYKQVKRKVSVGSNPGEKFYADIVRGQTVELDEIYKDMTDLTSLSRGDAMNAIDTLRNCLASTSEVEEMLILVNLADLESILMPLQLILWKR